MFFKGDAFTLRQFMRDNSISKPTATKIIKMLFKNSLIVCISIPGKQNKIYLVTGCECLSMEDSDWKKAVV